MRTGRNLSDKGRPESRRVLRQEDLRPSLGKIEKAFAHGKPLFALALYYSLDYWRGDPATLPQRDVNRQKQLVRLIRILFLKRFESSIVAFESSCQTLLLKLLAFLRKNIDSRRPSA